MILSAIMRRDEMLKTDGRSAPIRVLAVVKGDAKVEETEIYL